MDKYIGQYKVLCEWDRDTLEPLKDNTYIKCLRGGQIYRYDDDTLVYYKPTGGNSEHLCRKFTGVGVGGVDNLSTEYDIVIKFNEINLDKVDKEVKCGITGVNRKPWSVKNLRSLDWFKENKDEYIRKGLYSEISEEKKESCRNRLLVNILNSNAKE